MGGHLLAALKNRSEEAVGTYHTRPRTDLIAFDLTQGSEIKRILAEHRPEVVWMPAAMPDVDRCQREPELSRRINVAAVIDLAAHCQAIGAKFVFYSTDYVFDGTEGPYDETGVPNPLQIYGEHKLESEKWLLSHMPEALIIRTAWVYSQEPNPRNFVYRIEQQLASGQPLKAAQDQISTPSEAGELAERYIQAVREGRSGILHLVGKQRLSRYAWTVDLAKRFGHDERAVQPILTESLGLIAKRPLNGGLITRENI